MNDTFGAALARYRLRSNLTGKALAAAAGVSQQFVSDVEHGRRVPNREMVERLAGPLSVSERERGYLEERAFVERGDCCPRCGFGTVTP